MLRMRFRDRWPGRLLQLRVPARVIDPEVQPICPSTDSNAGGKETPHSLLHGASTESVHVAAAHRVAPAAVIHEAQPSKLVTSSDASGALPQTAPGELSVPLAIAGIRRKCKRKV